MIKLKISLFIIVLLLSNCYVSAQSDVIKYSFTKGQVLDVIFINTRTEPEVKELIQDYFKRAFPIAEAYGYHSLKGFGIKENVFGGYLPNSMIFGYWDNLKGREEFLKVIDSKMPDFHEMRRKIWSTFNLTYYEMKQDLTFEIDRSKFNMVTSLWKADNGFDEYQNSWKDKAENKGAVHKAVLTNGKSPFGYLYNPDVMMITEWPDEATFEAFQQQSIAMHTEAVKHVNQLIIK